MQLRKNFRCQQMSAFLVQHRTKFFRAYEDGLLTTVGRHGQEKRPYNLVPPWRKWASTLVARRLMSESRSWNWHQLIRLVVGWL